METLTAKQISTFFSQLEDQHILAKFNEHIFEIAGIQFGTGGEEGKIYLILED